MTSHALLPFSRYASLSRCVGDPFSQVPKWLIPLLGERERSVSRGNQGRTQAVAQTRARLPPPCSINSDARRKSGLRLLCSCAAVDRHGAELEVDVLVEGRPLAGQSSIVGDLARTLQEDALEALKRALELRSSSQENPTNKEMVELSIVLCDDAHMTDLNKEWRGINSPTDVLSFPLDDGEEEEDLPLLALGDLVISLDTASRQAEKRRLELLDECRVLLIHGLLHLMGFDHDRSPKAWKEMAQAEQTLMSRLGWQGKGLIEAAVKGGELHSTVKPETPERNRSSGPVVSLNRYKGDIQLISLDMDGTLLNSRSKILDSSRDAIRAVLAKGIKVMLATGKARPAALSACGNVGLAGDGLVVSLSGAGVFLQGLAVHDWRGKAMMGPNLSASFVASVFQYCEKQNVSCIAFLGDECATTKMTDEVEEMHSRYYEPLAKEVTIDQILQGPTPKKIVLMAEPSRILQEIQPHWERNVEGTGADVMIAVENHLELVPRGVNKWNGVKTLAASAGVGLDSVMAVGDGGNDFEMVQGAGLGIAMGNGVEKVKAAADAVVSSNDEDGLAEALERFIL
ncbi:hypothetical protein BSKO_01800 [Bryopsis sp. KO-2023]|nr:hypothetical protein BSKO_01800 [Bryopsis sp. KO-2023]